MPYRPAICSLSLGRAVEHDFFYKIECAARHGFKGIEVFYEDLEDLARKLPDYFSFDHPFAADSPSNPSTSQLLSAAALVRTACTERDLSIISLQPFLHYEGLRDRAAHARRIAEARVWLRLARELGTDIVLIPSTFLPREQLVADMDLLVADLQEIADLGLAAAEVSEGYGEGKGGMGEVRKRSPIRFAYEALCWGTLVNTWECSWEIVLRVDRPNFGLCLDSFHIAGRTFADPAVPGGIAKGGLEELTRSLDRLVAEVDPRKVFYVQVVDGEKLEQPLVEGHEYYVEGQDKRMSWSRNCRTFYDEHELGAYMPVRAVADAMLNRLGFEGWVSFELFNRCLWEKGEQVPERMAKRGMQSWRRLVNDLELKLDVSKFLVLDTLYARFVDANLKKHYIGITD